MSLILEALRKSEAERRRGETPSLSMELPPAPRATRTGIPGWAWGLLAAVALLATAWGVTRGLRGSASTATPEVETAAAPAISIEPRAQSLPPVRRLSPPSQPSAPARAPVSAPSGSEPPAATPTQQIVATPQPAPADASPPPVVRPLPAAPTPGDSIGTAALQLSDLSVAQRKALPALKLTMHMWNDDPAQRFVILDGNRLREGDRIGDAVVAAITSDGVVLDWNGRRLKLPIR